VPPGTAAPGSKLSGVHVRIHENAGHPAMWDNPDSCFDAIIGFVREVAGGTGKRT